MKTLQVWLGAVLLVLGMFAVISQPFVGVGMICASLFLLGRTTAADRSEATAVFFGFCLLCMVAYTVVALFQLIF